MQYIFLYLFYLQGFIYKGKEKEKKIREDTQAK